MLTVWSINKKNIIMSEPENLLSTDLQVDAGIQEHLLQTARWAKFLGIVGFIFSGLLLVISLFAFLSVGNQASNEYAYSKSTAVNSLTSLLFLLAITVVWFFASLYIFRFATNMKSAIQNTDQLAFNESFSNLSKNYKFMGIVTIIYLSLMLLAFLASIFLLSFRRY
jgi:magnesium-transporting ATPase (P-type)